MKRQFVKALAIGIAKRVGGFVDRAEVAILCITMILIAVLLIANVPARELGHSIIFAEELTQFLTIVCTFVALSYAVRKARHIRMGAIFDLMNDKAKKVLIFLTSAISACVMFFMAYYAFQYVVWLQGLGQTTPSLQVPIWIVVVIAPVGFLFATIQCVATIIRNIVEKEPWISQEQKHEYDVEL